MTINEKIQNVLLANRLTSEKSIGEWLSIYRNWPGIAGSPDFCEKKIAQLESVERQIEGIRNSEKSLASVDVGE